MIPKVSIITPTYNHEVYIRQCIKSVLSQTYSAWEQIIVEDASADKTFQIASYFAKMDKRIKIIKHQKRWGLKKLSTSYNQALREAKGEYVAILEGDDFWPKDKLKKQMRSLENKENALLSFGDCILTNVSGAPIKLFTYRYDAEVLENNPIGSILTLFANLNFSIIPVTVIIKKEALLEIGGFQKNKIYPFTDIPTFLALSIKGSFHYLNEPLGYYRKQLNSSWFNYASQTSAMGKEELQGCINNFLKKNEKNPVIQKILRGKDEFTKSQAKFIRRKKLLKPLSIFLNTSVFHNRVSPLTLLFVFEYVNYKIRKLFK